jgi:uncharacterized membrane protein YesL
MELRGFTGGFYRLSEWIMRLAYVNILWIAFTFLGLVVLGFFPATAAMFAVVRKWVMGDSDIPVFKTFWNSYRTEFTKVNLLGLVIIVIGLILYIDLRIFPFENGWIFLSLRVILISLFFVYLVMLIYFFPVYVHYDLKFFKHIKYALMMGIAAPLQTILLLVVTYAVYFIMVSIPGLIPFFSGSLLSYVWMWMAYQVFSKLEHRGREEMQEKEEEENHDYVHAESESGETR